MIRIDLNNQVIRDYVAQHGVKAATIKFNCSDDLINRIFRGERREDVYMRPGPEEKHKIPWADDCPKDLRNSAQRIQ